MVAFQIWLGKACKMDGTIYTPVRTFTMPVILANGFPWFIIYLHMKNVPSLLLSLSRICIKNLWGSLDYFP